jgi:hypothetical protein
MQGIQSLPYEVRNSPLVPSGGIENFEKAADMLAGFGREGDTYLVHAAEGETVIPLEVLDANPRMKNMIFTQMKEMGLEPKQYIVGDKLNSINPVTGQAEFFFKKLFRKVKKIVKKIAPIVLPIIAPYLLPLMPVAFATGLGSLAGGLIAGQSVGDALKGAVISGGLAGLGNMAFRGETFMGGSFFGSTANPTGSFADFSFKDAFSNVQNPLSNVGMTAGDPTPEGTDFFTGEPKTGDLASTSVGGPADASMASKTIPKIQTPNWGSPSADSYMPTETFNVDVDSPFFNTQTNSLQSTPYAGADDRNWLSRNVWDIGEGEGKFEALISPNRSSIQPNMSELAADYKAYAADIGFKPSETGFNKYVASKAPGVVQKYGPLAATLIGGGAASDLAFGTNFVLDGTDADGDGYDDVTGQKLYKENPGKYAFGRGFYGNNPYYQEDTFVPIDVRNAANATNTANAVMVKGGGSIEGPGTPTSDSIPAMLSDGEFVMNARSVRGAGDGDRKEGARRMYAMMREFEGKA